MGVVPDCCDIFWPHETKPFKVNRSAFCVSRHNFFEETNENIGSKEPSSMPTSDYPFDGKTTISEDSIGIPEIVDNDVGLYLSLENEIIMENQENNEMNSSLAVVPGA